MNIVVLGSGGCGTAAAMLLSDNGHTVALWSQEPKKAELMIGESRAVSKPTFAPYLYAPISVKK